MKITLISLIVPMQTCLNCIILIFFLTGEVSESGSDQEAGQASESEEEIFTDGLDENLMGDEEDKQRLQQMTEKEREQELFNRIERRAVLKTR